MSSYPSVITSFTNPLANQKLNAPSHSGIETSQNTDLTAIETFLGTEGNTSTAGTLIYDIRSAGSNGGGHVQSANKGGTGQITFNQGDILVAQSSSVLSKLAIGLDGQILVANSSVATGINWANSPTNKLFSSASVITTLVGIETSIAGGTIQGGTLGVNNAIRITALINTWGTRSNASILVKGVYGGGTIASVMLTSPGQAPGPLAGTIQFTMIANQSTSLQRGILILNLNKDHSNPSGVTSVVSANLYNSGTSSVASGSSAPMGITALMSDSNDNLITDGYLVEKIS